MGLFDIFKKGSGKTPEPADRTMRDQMIEFLLASIKTRDGRTRVEDLLTAAAVVVAERCIDAAGDFPLRDHDLKPGSPVFSTKANALICADLGQNGVGEAPENTIIGYLRERLDRQLYPDTDFPSLTAVFTLHASSIGAEGQWGKAPLSIHRDHHPFILPVRFGCESRDRIDAILAPVSGDKMRCLFISTDCLAQVLRMVAAAIDHKLALTLVLETLNGMAKTAPMTAKAMRESQMDAPVTTPGKA